MNKIDPNSVLAFNLATSAEDYITKLNAQIEEWKTAQYEMAHSATAIRYYAELVYNARKEIERVTA